MSGKFNAPKLMGNCVNCYYYTPTRPKLEEGVCHRYPKPLDRDDMDYCGEFAWKGDASMLKEGSYD